MMDIATLALTKKQIKVPKEKASRHREAFSSQTQSGCIAIS